MAVAIAEAEDVSENRDGGCTPGVGQAFFEPVVRIFESLHEEVAKDRVEMVDDLAERLDALVHGLCLDVCYVFAAVRGLEVIGEMPLVGRHEIIVKGDCVWHEFDNAGGCCQRQYLVRSDSEAALPGSLLCL